MNKDSKIYVAGHTGLVGSAVIRKLKELGYDNLIFKTHEALDLCDLNQVGLFFEKYKPEYVFLCAAKVGGIYENILHPVEFLLYNNTIATNIIALSYEYEVKKLLNLASSCVYPRICAQPMTEDKILTGKFEPTNEAYALAKVMAIKLCRYYNIQYGTNFISLMPPNIYGSINENFDLNSSHFIPALIRKFYEAVLNDKDNVALWGTGNAYREVMHVDDLADACVYFMENYDYKDIGEFVNVGTGKVKRIREYAEVIKEISGFIGNILYDTSKPDGMPMKQLDISKMKLFGWEPKIKLEDGLREVYEYYKNMRRN